MSTELTVLAAPAVPPALPAPGEAAPGLLEIVLDGELHIPGEVRDLASFRRWALTFECVPRLRLAWLAGVLWVDRTMEQLYTHNQVKAQIGAVLTVLVNGLGQGLYIPDGMQLSNTKADLSTIPDGAYASFDAMDTGRCREVPGKQTGVVELEGSPEMVLEVVSESSVDKDMERLPRLYHLAEVREYWRVDARGDLRFEILRWTDTGYVATPEPDGWWRSDGFGRSFRLTQGTYPRGQLRVTLEVRE
jgi:Uma2 family endonuclease